jgi:hypothetical protein
LRFVFRCCAGSGEECEAGDFGTDRLTVGAALRTTVAGAAVTDRDTGAAVAAVRSAVWRALAADRSTMLTAGATARCAGAATTATAAGPPPSGSVACAGLAAAALRAHADSRPARPIRQEGQERLAHINIQSVDALNFGAVIHRSKTFYG